MKIELYPLTRIRPYENNPRHNDEAMDAVAASIREFGFRQPLVIDDEGVIIVGHTRYKAALKLGPENVPVHIATGLTPAQVKAYRLADNQTASLSHWNQDKLLVELAALQQMDFDFNLTGFSTEELLQLFHTDPPYNVKVEPRSNNAISAGLSSFQGIKHHQTLDMARHPQKAKSTSKQLRAKDRPLANDFVSEQEYDRMLRAWFGNLARVLEPGRSFYLWGGYANCGNYPPVFQASGQYFSQALIWVKEHPVLTRNDFMGNHEWCFYGWREGAAHQFFGPANITDVWSIKKVNPQSMVHLTEKPVELAARSGAD